MSVRIQVSSYFTTHWHFPKTQSPRVSVIEELQLYGQGNASALIRANKKLSKNIQQKLIQTIKTLGKLHEERQRKSDFVSIFSPHVLDSFVLLLGTEFP